MNSRNAEETEEAASEVEYLYLSTDNSTLRDIERIMFLLMKQSKNRQYGV